MIWPTNARNTVKESVKTGRGNHEERAASGLRERMAAQSKK
jgi:hypothetical protein